MVFAELWKKIRNRGTPPKFELPTTHNCLKKVLLLSQIVGVFPLNHLNEEPEKLHFTFKSWKVLYTSLTSFGYLFCASLSFYKAFKIGILLNQLITPLFFFHSFMTSVLFSQVASRWPLFLNEWTKIEINLLKHYQSTTDLHKKIRYSAFGMIFVALLEHCFSMLNYVYSSKCENNSTGVEHFFKKQFHYIFTYMPYNIVFGLCLTTFGLLPVNGVTSEKCNLTFSWYSKKVFYSKIIISGSIFMTTTSFYRILNSGYNLTTFGSFIFNANSAIEGIIFFNLAKSWPQLIEKWSRVEMALDNWKNDKSLKRKFYLTICTIMSAAAVEHILSIVNTCSQIPSEVEDKYTTYFLNTYPHLFNFFEFSVPLAIFAVV
uniref:Gustatory receptor candidate 40 n=1 Tax=Tribolium castaneum TaxID=7070 RepID=A2AXA2_TRICA|nr:gustatory receptor candidate 40 [Tribolium castaneum]